MIGTKFGNTFDETSREITGGNASPDYVRRACEASLRRLGTDRIELYQFHLSEYDPEAAEDVRGVLEELVSEGSIRAYAWSTDDPERARIFAQGANCGAVQHELNVLQDAPAMLDLCAAEGLASVNRSPLAMGLLTGKFSGGSRLAANHIRGDPPQWLKYFRDGQPAPEWLEKLAAVRAVLTDGGRSLAAGALAWILGRSERTIPIPGFRTVAQVEDNLGALAHGPLTSGQLREVDRLLGRYNSRAPSAVAETSAEPAG